MCVPLFAQSDDAQRDILRYGTDNEINELIKTLKKDNAEYLDEELTSLARTTKNPVIKSQVLGFFSARSKTGLESVALTLIDNRDNEETVNVLAALDYLGTVKYSSAQKTIRALVDDGNDRLTNAALRTVGSAVNEANAGDAAEFLIDYYETKNPGEETQREIVMALGETGSKRATEFLSGIIGANERPVLTMTALSSVAKIADPDALDAVTGATASKDPAIRAAAVEALGSFDGKAVDEALLDAFRDSHFRTRLAAVKAAGKRKLAPAIPFLKFRSEKDEVPSVQDESLRSLGAIGNAESAAALEAVFDEKRTPDRLKGIAAQQLVQIDAGRYAQKIITKYDEAKRLNQKQLAAALISALGKAKTDEVRSLTGRLFASKDATDKAYALELTRLNHFDSFRPDVQRLANEENSGIARRAREVLADLETR